MTFLRFWLPLGGEQHGALSAVFGFPLEGKLSRSDWWGGILHIRCFYTSSAASSPPSFPTLRKTMFCYATTLRVVYLQGEGFLAFSVTQTVLKTRLPLWGEAVTQWLMRWYQGEGILPHLMLGAVTFFFCTAQKNQKPYLVKAFGFFEMKNGKTYCKYLLPGNSRAPQPYFSLG